MKKAFYSSLSIHILVFILISITLPEIKTKEIDYISVEIINEETNDDANVETNDGTNKETTVATND